MLYVRKLFNQDLNKGKQIAFPKEPSNSFFSFDFSNQEKERSIKFVFKAKFGQFDEFDGTIITSRIYSAGSESRMDGEVKAFIRDKLNAQVEDLLIFNNNGSGFTDFEVMFVPKTNPSYPLLLKLCVEGNHSIYSFDTNRIEQNNLQQIYYGAPGTGKSHTINRITKGESVIRTTFHPDSDYSTFVGAYKPSMDGKNITYKFVKQAFLKAYLLAWKNYTLGLSSSSLGQKTKIEVRNGNDKWILDNVFDDRITYTKESIIETEDIKDWVKKCWDIILQSDDPDNYSPSTNDRYQATLCVWFKDNYGLSHTNDECWDTIQEVLKSGKTVEAVPGKSQKYSVSCESETKVKIVSKATAWRKTIENNYNDPGKSGNSVQKAIAAKMKGYESPSFEEAWNLLKNDAEQANEITTGWNGPVTATPQYLIIEEINRGNCAQIFGDLFQLLDRSDNGFSAYPIETDNDIADAIKTAFAEEKDYKLDYNINIDGVIDGYVSNYNSSLSKDVQSGRVLLLPPNFYIWATMNTSDQSLFPIDSAFKRRWEWKYIKIKKGKDENGNSLDWVIDVNVKTSNIEEKPLLWWDFLKKINEIIASMTSSADKQLGYFFCKADKDGKISADTFVSKVIFYLWNDVFKDYGFEDASLFQYTEKDETGNEKTKELTFPDFYDEDGEEVNIVRLANFIEKVMNWKKTNEMND